MGVNALGATDVLLRMSDWPIPRPDRARVARKFPEAPRHAVLKEDSLALLFLWGMFTIVLIALGIGLAAASSGSEAHATVTRVAAALPIVGGAGAAIQGARYEWNALIVAIRRRRARGRELRPERSIHWPARAGDLDLLLQLALGVIAVLATQPK